MALMGEDIFVKNVLDDDLEQVEEAEAFQEPDVEDNEDNDEPDDENKKPDDEVKIQKKRKLNLKPRLNILRLMSEKNGLTVIQKVFKDVKFKGKGHERDDLNLIMRKMEIWAHQLYPSMQFDDCLGRLEKLGTTKPVTTYVTKIRMGLEDEVSRIGDIIEDQDDSGNEGQPATSVSDFDRLLDNQNRQKVPQINSTSGVSSELTAEQRERMMRNRLIAEQRRLARMKARKEQEELAKEQSQANSISESAAVIIDDDVPIPVLNKTIDDRLSLVPSSSSGINDVNLDDSEKNVGSTVECSAENTEMIIDHSDVPEVTREKQPDDVEVEFEDVPAVSTDLSRNSLLENETEPLNLI